jgi:hypothetical protein
VKRIKVRISQWDGYDSKRVLYAGISTLIGLGSVFVGAPIVLGMWVGLLIYTCLTAIA